MDSANSSRVVIVGAGLAGLAAATALASRNFQVTVVEARKRPGGRASSFEDAQSGQLLDTCQHVSMGCCTNLADFFERVGVRSFLKAQSRLYFMTPDRRISTFEGDRVLAPFHLARSFLHSHFFSWTEKLRIAYGLLRLQEASVRGDPPFCEWLLAHHQTPRTIQRFWGLILTSALNEVPERIGFRYARKVFLDGFLRHRRGFEVEIPTVPLGKLYGEKMLQWLDDYGVRLILGKAVKKFNVQERGVVSVEFRTSEILSADWYVSTVPFDRLADLLPQELIATEPYFRRIGQLETSPIVSVHLWYDRSITPLPHVVLIDSIGQWIFNRGEVSPGEYYVQVVVSAARQLRSLGHEEVKSQIVAEMSRLFPAASAQALRRARIISEHNATFCAVPGVDRLRPDQSSPLENLFVAGDWTATKWPATMEGAVRSGYLAAEKLLLQTGRKEKILVDDL